MRRLHGDHGRRAIRSCVTPVGTAQNKPITTLEGLGSTKKMHKLRQAFVDEQAVQCGYCINGMIMTSKALLEKNPKPSDAQIKEAWPGTVPLRHSSRIVRAVKRASGQMVVGKERRDEDPGTSIGDGFSKPPARSSSALISSPPSFGSLRTIISGCEWRT